LETKVCSKCGQEFPLTTEYFGKRKDSKDGFRNECKVCKKEYNKQLRLDNLEHYKERDRQYHATNRETCNQRSRKYRAEHRDEQIIKQRQYYYDNREKILEDKKEYHQKNRDVLLLKSKKYWAANRERLLQYCRDYNARRSESQRAKLKKYRENNKDIIKARQREYSKNHRLVFNMASQRRKARLRQLPATLTEQQWQIIKDYFNNKCCYCGKEKPLQQEHFIPVAKGGGYEHNNIICACQSCNGSKGAKDPLEWYPQHKYYSKKREAAILKFLGYDKQGTQQPALMI